MVFKFKFMVQGGHTHYRLWTGKTTHGVGLNGPRQTMTNEEWTIFQTILEKGTLPDLAAPDVVVLVEHEVIFEEVEDGQWFW